MPEKKNILHWFMMFVLIHMSSSASVIAQSNLGLAIFSSATILLFIVQRRKFDKPFLIFTFLYLLISLGYFLKFGWLNFTATIRIYLKIIYVYMTIKIIGYYFLHYFTDVVIKLAAISIPLFAIQFFFPEQMMAINGFLEPIIPQVHKGGYDYSNSFIFTINPWGLERNSGFMWEPGAFSAVCSVALFLNLTINKFKRNRGMWILLIAILTTASTTGFLLLLLIASYYLLNQPNKHIIIGFPLLLIAAIATYSHPEVSEKIKDRMEGSEHSIESARNYEGSDEGISIGRFGSMQLDMKDFVKFPITGFGAQQTERGGDRYTVLVRANGLSDFMVMYGGVGLLFLIIGTLKSFQRLQVECGGRAYIMGTVIILTLAFSNPVLNSPLSSDSYSTIWLSDSLPTQTHTKRNMHKIAIIIPSFNRKDYLLEVLGNLRSQTGRGFQLRTYAVIDGSTDGSFEAVSTHFPEVTIVPGTGDWFYTKSINEGVLAAQAWNPDFILAQNDDVLINHDYVEHLLNAHVNHGKPNIMGSLSVTTDEDHGITFAGIEKIKWWRMKWVNRIAPHTKIDLSTLTGVHSSEVLPGRGMLIPMKAFMELNMFDLAFPQYGSDDDFCLRAKQAGYDIMISYDAVVYSHHRLTGAGDKSQRNTPFTILKAFRNKHCTLYLPKTALMIKRHGNRTLMPLTLGIIIAASLLSSLRFRA